MYLWFNAFVATSTAHVMTAVSLLLPSPGGATSKGRPSLRACLRPRGGRCAGTEDSGGPWLGKEDLGGRCDVSRDVKEHEGVSRAREVVCLNWSLNPASVAWLKRFAKR